MDKQTILKQYFGHFDFREGQTELIDNILAGKDVLGIMPTGAGKSICYQVPALMLDGITLVISPLISLMKDQVNALVQAGVKAAYLNSSLTSAQYVEVLRRAQNGVYKIIYVAPERLVTEEFLNFAQSVKISMVTVDEAHCVSQWGQDFRPSYLKIIEFIEKLKYRPVISGFTATATQEIREDIIYILRLKKPFVITTGFNRENLYFEVQKPMSKLVALMDIMERKTEKSGIIYCATRKNVEEVCGVLNERGYSATRYHAGLGAEERRCNQDDFIYDRKAIMVATNAFGMGIDKSNVAYVVHFNMPKNLESYYQEAGRAGRDGEPAECILLYNRQDVRTNKFLIENSSEQNMDISDEMREAVKDKDLERLKIMTYYCTSVDCLREYILRYFGDKTTSFCGNCSNCNSNFETVDITLDAQKIISCLYRLEQKNKSFGATMIIDILRGSKNEKIKRFGMDEISTYGIMADISVNRLRKVIDFLLENGYIIQSGDPYPIIKLTERSTEIIREKMKLEMKLPVEKVPSKTGKKLPHALVDNMLFQELKALRSQLAMEAHVPAYIIFADAVLSDMCKKLPQTKEAFLEVSGVGTAKLERYGDIFIAAIQKYVSENPDFIKNTVLDNEKESEEAVEKEVTNTNKWWWTKSEDAQLKAEHKKGLSVRKMCEIHNKTELEILTRLKKLNLSF